MLSGDDDKVFEYDKPLGDQLPYLSAEGCAELSGHISFKIFTSRLQANGVKVSASCMLFILLECRTPGEAVLWAFTVYCANVRDGTKYGMLQFSEDFALGFPSRQYIQQVWESQKSAGAPLGNRLDGEEWSVLAAEVLAAKED
jgi:hypothetical protein